MTDFYKLPFSNVKKLMANFFVKEKYVLHYGSWHFFKARIKYNKKMHCLSGLS